MHAQAALTPPPTKAAIPDVDGDALPDVVVGSPQQDGGRGAVDVFLTASAPVELTAADVPGGTRTVGDLFGAASCVLDADGDGHADVVVGAPGENGVGAVHVFFGSASGINHQSVLSIPGAHRGDRFGAALACSSGDRQVRPSVWIGAPGRTVGGHPNAGAAAHWEFDAASTGMTTRWVRTVTQNSPGIPDFAETGDQFGEVLGIAFPSTLIVGIPHEDVGGAADAGMVTVITDTHARAWTRNSAGIAGAPQAGDRFGAAVLPNAIGIPGATVGGRRGAGAVQMFRGYAGNGLTPTTLMTQNSTFAGYAVPGVAEAGDHFGASLAATDPQDFPEIAIGAPGEDLGKVADAGTVTELAAQSGCSSCQPVVYARGSHLPGAPAAGDHLGATLSTVSYQFDNPDNADFEAMVLIGAPGIDAGSSRDVGAAFQPYIDAQYSPLRPQPGLDFGRVIGEP